MSTDSEENDFEYASEDDMPQSENEENEVPAADDDLGPEQVLRKTWGTINPPVSQEAILGKWYAVTYETKRTSRLFIGKIVKRFLTDKDGSVESLEIRCLKPKVGYQTTIEDTPEHLPDISVFNLTDVIYGPLEVISVRGGKFNVPNYEKVVEQFNNVKKIQWTNLLH